MGDAFDVFCAGVLDRTPWPGNLAPAVLAEEFVDYFGLSGFPRFQQVTQLVQRSGVGQVVETRLPPGLRGAHFGLVNEPYTIQYRDDDWEGGREHTVLHETYEILQEKFRDLCPTYSLPRKPVLCRRADRFAAAVLMQPEVFALFAQATGLDLVALQRMYRRSYVSVALRLVEVMPHQPLLAAVYERWDGGDPLDWEEDTDAALFRVGAAVNTRGFPAQVMPRRHTPVLAGSAAWRVLESGLTVLVERVTGFDRWGLPDLAVIARPVRWHGRLAKVLLVAVPVGDRSLLETQLAQGPVERVPRTFQMI
jgi:hypothetical protein